MDRILHFVPDSITIIRIDQRIIGARGIPEEVGGFVSSQAFTAVADKLHRPIPIVLASINHTGKIGEQYWQAPLIL
jgi:hypothetical protein